MKKSNKVLWVFAGLIFIAVLVLSILNNIHYFSNSKTKASLSYSFNLPGDKKIIGNKEMTNKFMILSAFDTINANGDFAITLNPGTENSIIMTSDENILPYINISQNNNEISLSTQQGVSLRSLQPKKAVITASTMLNHIDLSGISSLQAMNLNTNNLTLEMRGMNLADIQGNIKKIQIDLSGKPILHLKLFDADNIILDIHGMGTVYLSGKTKSLNISSSGNAMVSASNLIADNVVITTAGMSNINIHALKTLSVITTGKSMIKYSGNPNITKNIAGNAIIEKSSDYVVIPAAQ